MHTPNAWQLFFAGENCPTRLRRACRWIAQLSATLLLLACAAIPAQRVALDHIEFVGNSQVASDDIQEKLASTESPRFLGMFRGVIYDYQVFDRYILERDLQGIERFYRALGFYQARVRAGRVYFTKGRHARVQIVIAEGAPTLVQRVDIHGLDSVPRELGLSARRSVLDELPLGKRFEESAFERSAQNLARALTDEGYAHALVRRSAQVDLTRNAASVGYWVTPGPRSYYGAVTIVGLGDLPEAPVRRALDLRSGDPYSSSELESAERAVLELGVFSSVKVAPRTGSSAGKAATVPIEVRVEPSPLRSLNFGFGVQIDSLRTDVHARAGWEHRNFLGGLRKFLVEALPGAVIYPTRLPSLEPPERLLPQGRLRSEFRQLGAFEARTNFFARLEGNLYPVLLASQPREGAPILGYRDVRGAIGLERSFSKVYAALSHNVQTSTPFTYVGTLDPDLHRVIVSYPELVTTLDLRDNQLHPHAGAYASNALQVAGVAGDALDIKLQPEVRGYVPLGRRLTLAARGAVGLLFPQNYGDSLFSKSVLAETGGASRAAWVRDIQLVFLRGLFGGGPGSNRGYAAREIGPHGIVPFYNPQQSTAELSASCNLENPEPALASCNLPLGGFTLWEASLELRYPILGPFAGSVFSDAADVSIQEFDFHWNRPHLSVGVGFRYDTPVGPIRLDVGYRVPGVQTADASHERPPSELLGLPLAVSFGIGEAF